tara:strand:- start:420 stop:770 length:351 start_codon:yes stop_codon:yes gene_type:complete
MKMQISEVADRFSICKLKEERTDLDMTEELEAYRYELRDYQDIGQWVSELYQINGNIWDLESDIRKGKERELGLEEVGRRALLIRDWNNKRVATKNEITEHYNDGFTETKKNHASE